MNIVKFSPCSSCDDDEQVPKKILGFKAWFDDGKMYKGTLDDWLELPNDGLLYLVIYRDNDTRKLHCAVDYYFYYINKFNQPVYGSGDMPVSDIKLRYPMANIIRGRWTDDITMQLADIKAVNELTF